MTAERKGAARTPVPGRKAPKLSGKEKGDSVMNIWTFVGIVLPLLGTALGAACVFVLRGSLSERVNKALLGFASGVMVAASVW